MWIITQDKIGLFDAESGIVRLLLLKVGDSAVLRMLGVLNCDTASVETTSILAGIIIKFRDQRHYATPS